LYHGFFTVVIVVVGVVGGVFTATESAAIAVVYAFCTDCCDLYPSCCNGCSQSDYANEVKKLGINCC